MTDAAAYRFERRNHGRGHSYTLNGAKQDGVTTVIDTMGKPSLINWAAETTAKAAVDQWEELAALPVSARLDRLTRARWEVSDTAKINGTKVHGWAEAVVAGRAVDVPPEYAGAVEALARLMDAYRMDPVVVERPVFHAFHGWAGTPDLLCGMGTTLWLIDWKTGRRVYDEVALQLSAYAHATHYLTPAGTVAEWMPPERCGVVHITTDSATLYPVDAGDATYTVFRYLQQVYRWRVRVADDSPIGSPATPDTAGILS